MKLLEPLVAARRSLNRFTLDDYVSWLNAAGLGGSFSFNGTQFPLGLQQTMPGQKVEPIDANFAGLVDRGLKANGIVWTCANVRLQVFSQARFLFQELIDGRPGETSRPPRLRRIEEPWPGGTLVELLSRMLLHADFAGNAYVALDDDGNLGFLRPDWTDIVLGARTVGGRMVGFSKLGYAHYDEGKRNEEPVLLTVREVAHFAPYPDPLASYRGMSWLTPIIRDLTSDDAATRHKQAFYENAATPNLAVMLKETVTPEQFDDFVSRMDAQHKGPWNAGKTLYLGGGADVEVVGKDMRQVDFKSVQGAGETRIAAASGVGAVIAQLSEGMQGSALNAGNYVAVRRRFSDIPMRHAWQAAAGALERIVGVPQGSRLWYDVDDIAFLQEDARDDAEIVQMKAAAMRQLIDGGYEPDSVTEAVDAGDLSRLEHGGLPSVQLQPPDVAGVAPSEEPTPPEEEPPDE